MEEGQRRGWALERWRQIVVGIGEGLVGQNRGSVCVQTILVHNESQSAWWKRHVQQEDSQSTNPNELQLEIRRRRGRTMNTFWMRMKGKDGGRRKVAC